LKNSSDIATTSQRVPNLDFPDSHRLRSRDVFRLVTRVWPFIRPYRKHLGLLILAIMPALPAGLFVLALTRILFDVVGNGHPLTPFEAWLIHVPLNAARETALLHTTVLGVIVAAVVLPCAGLVVLYVLWILQRITNLFRVDLYSRLQELSLRFHGEEKIGDAMFRMFQDSAAIPQVIDSLVLRPLMAIPFVIVDLIWLATFNWKMAFVALLVIPAEFLLAIVYGDSLRGAFIGEREATAQATTRIEETLASIKTVKAFGTEESESGIYARDNWDAFIAARRARLMLVRYRVLNNTLWGVAYLAALYLGARQVLAGGVTGAIHAAVSLGTFQGTLGILSRVTRRITMLGESWGNLQDMTVAMARVLELLGSVPEADVKSGERLPPGRIEALRFEDVGFSYDPAEPVLRDISLEVHAGTITAFVGPSGSGKSTLVALLLRFADPASGRIMVNGIDLRDFQLAGWRGRVSVALQENPLFTATIRDNIAYSKPDATVAEVWTAVRRADLELFVNSLPRGLDTMLGEKGAKLSTGQAQRISLARALLRDAPILLLDEPTASLDGATEEHVLDGIRQWLNDAPEGRMVIIATHRRTTAAIAERVFEVTNGTLRSIDPSEREHPSLKARHG
jgi:ABC-type multidrug transport system fused ATPase/permease subunit